jgi:hypothetical protein
MKIHSTTLRRLLLVLFLQQHHQELIPIEGAQETSENGTSITSEIITEIMPYMDAYEFSFLHVDGHGSRFVVDFLTDMNSENRKGFVSIGVPYETNLWQVTDSTFKKYCSKRNHTFRR